MTPIKIRTKRLLLRAVESADLDGFFQWFADPEVMKYEPIAPHTDPQQTKDFIDETISHPSNGVLDFSVCILLDPKITDTHLGGSEDAISMIVIGRVAIRNEEIEFMLNQQYWGKGFAFEMVDGLLKQFWSTVPDVNIVKADVDPRNDRSLRLLKRLGFVVVGTAKRTFKTHIGWCDSVYLEIRRPVG